MIPHDPGVIPQDAGKPRASGDDPYLLAAGATPTV